MPQQPQGAQHVLVAHPQPEPLVGDDLECALDHRHGLAVGNTLCRVLQVVEGKPQATAQAVGVDAVGTGHFGQGLQQER
ncbi:hypothetical protein D3C76_1688500 [compost metagenome]